MNVNISKTNITGIYFIRKTIRIYFSYFFGDVLILRRDRLNDLGFMLDGKLFFNHQAWINYVPSQALRLVGLVRLITFPQWTALYRVIEKSRNPY
jgi:hypothetical protein